MIEKIQKVLNTQTLRQTVVTSLSTFLSSALGAVFYLLLARFLGPSEYGLYSLAMATASVVTSVSDLGLGQSLIRFVGANRQDKKYLPFVNLALRIKLISGVLVVLIFSGLSSVLAKHVFHQPTLASLLPLVGIAVLAQLLFFLCLAVFQGLQKFSLWGSFQVGTNIFRLIILVPAIIFFPFSAMGALIVFIVAYVVWSGLSIFWFDTKMWKASLPAKEVLAFWNFNKWTAATGILTAAVSRIDILLTARFLDLSQVGVYSLATIMVAFLPQLAGAMGAVTTSKFASFSDPEAAKKYLAKSIWFVGGISILVALAMIPAALLVIWFAGRGDYATAFTPFVILLVGLVVFLFTNPIRDSLMYFHAKPQFFFWLNIGQALTVLAVGWNLVPMFGVVGSAVSFIAGQIFVATASIWYYRKIVYA